MKSLCTKITAIVAMVISVLVLLSFGMMVVLVSMENPVIDQDDGFVWIIFYTISIIISLFLYAIDAFIKSCMKIDPVFNMVLSFIIFAEICISILFFAMMAPLLMILGWLLNLAIFVWEIISIKRHIKMKFPRTAMLAAACRGKPRLTN